MNKQKSANLSTRLCITTSTFGMLKAGQSTVGWIRGGVTAQDNSFVRERESPEVLKETTFIQVIKFKSSKYVQNSGIKARIKACRTPPKAGTQL